MAKLDIIQYPCKNNRCYQQAVKRKPIGIQLHSIGCGQGTAKSVADYWNSPNVKALVQYLVDSDIEGKVLATLPEDIYPWADAGYGNRNLIAIEMCESDFMKYDPNSANYTITNKQQFIADIKRSYVTAVLLCADICMRYDWDPWKKLPSGLYLISSHNEGRLAGLSSAHVDPDHIWCHINKSMDIFRGDVVKALAGATYVPITNEIRWFRVRKSWTDVSSQFNAYESKENAINSCPPGYAVYDSEGNEIYRNELEVTGTQASEFANLSESVAAEKILKLVHENDKSGVLYSVSAAQCILESGYVKTTLAKVANNCFGMKTTLSGNTWDSWWDGVSKVTLPTWEHYNGKDVTVNADFRRYPCIEDSIEDHSEYLLGAMNGDKLRYKGLLVAKDYREAITIIKNGGYATDPNYISKICNIIQRFGLDRYDHEVTGEKKEEPEVKPEKKVTYRVQVGRYASLALAKGWAATVTDITKLQCSIEPYQGDYQVICGSFESEAGANVRKALLEKEFLVPCEVKKVTI